MAPSPRTSPTHDARNAWAPTRWTITALSLTDNQRELARKLGDLGLSPDIIADILNAPVQPVRALISVRTNTLAPEDEQIAERMRRLANLAIDKSFQIMQWGPPQAQMQIIKSLLSASGRLLGAGQTGATEEARMAFEGLLTAMRDTPESRKVVLEGGVIDVDPGAVTLPAYDQDEIA